MIRMRKRAASDSRCDLHHCGDEAGGRTKQEGAGAGDEGGGALVLELAVVWGENGGAAVGCRGGCGA